MIAAPLRETTREEGTTAWVWGGNRPLIVGALGECVPAHEHFLGPSIVLSRHAVKGGLRLSCALSGRCARRCFFLCPLSFAVHITAPAPVFPSP